MEQHRFTSEVIEPNESPLVQLHHHSSSACSGDEDFYHASLSSEAAVCSFSKATTTGEKAHHTESSALSEITERLESTSLQKFEERLTQQQQCWSSSNKDEGRLTPTSSSSCYPRRSSDGWIDSSGRIVPSFTRKSMNDISFLLKPKELGSSGDLSPSKSAVAGTTTTTLLAQQAMNDANNIVSLSPLLSSSSPGGAKSRPSRFKRKSIDPNLLNIGKGVSMED